MVQSRQVTVGGEVWTVHQMGAAAVGSRADHGARLLSIAFEAPGDQANPERTCYVMARGLDEVAEDVLAALLEEEVHKPDVTSGLPDRAERMRGRGRPRRRGGP